MTHESFKDIVSFYIPMTKNSVNKFLDGESQDSLLSKWFTIWKTGNFRKIFDEIEILNDLYYQLKTMPQPLRKPKDAGLSRQRSNKNVI